MALPEKDALQGFKLRLFVTFKPPHVLVHMSGPAGHISYHVGTGKFWYHLAWGLRIFWEKKRFDGMYLESTYANMLVDIFDGVGQVVCEKWDEPSQPAAETNML